MGYPNWKCIKHALQIYTVSDFYRQLVMLIPCFNHLQSDCIYVWQFFTTKKDHNYLSKRAKIIKKHFDSIRHILIINCKLIKWSMNLYIPYLCTGTFHITHISLFHISRV